MKHVLICVALAGCAAQPLPVLTPDIAQQMPAAELCLGLSTFRPSNVPQAQAEIARRGINCQDHSLAMQGLIQQRAAMQQAAPVYVPLPPLQYNPIMAPEVRCTTQRVMNQIQTVCR